MSTREVTEVRGSEVRCFGSEASPHPELTVKLPPNQTVRCPICGRSYRRSETWKHTSSAVWPHRK